MSALGRRLEDFGTRSLVMHAAMVVSLLAGVVAAFAVEGQVGTVSFVALVNFTAGMWVCQSVHSLGNPDYRGVLNTLRNHGS